MKFLTKIFFSWLLISYVHVQADDGQWDCCTPSASCNFDIDLKASYLYWGVQEDQLAFALEDVLVFQGTGPVTKSKIKTHPSKWDSGVRLEGDWQSPCQPIACNFGWTYFQTKSTGSAKSIDPLFPTVGVTTISALPMQGSPFYLAQSAKSHWGINVNEFTFDLAYTSCGSFRPYVGIMGAIIDQKQKIRYDGLQFTTAPINLSITRKSDFCGIGPRLGTNFHWHLCNGFSFLANANAAYLFGKCNTKNRISAPADIAFNFTDINEKVYRGRPMASGLLGLEWKRQVNNCYALSISIAYEFQYWWRQWHSDSNFLGILTSGEGQWGDLSMHGLVLSGGISF